VDQTIEEILRDTRFYELLLGFDRQIADAAHADRCQKCGAALHWGSYERKPRGGPVGLGPEHRRRFSLCCAADGCRKRETPGSLRFLGRKVFLGAMVVVAISYSCPILRQLMSKLMSGRTAEQRIHGFAHKMLKIESWIWTSIADSRVFWTQTTDMVRPAKAGAFSGR
jgi:hypothetical protein